MPTADLRAQLSELANEFANAVLAAVRSASVDELAAESGGSGRVAAGRSAGARAASGRLPRRSAAQIEAALGKVVALLKTKRAGLRSEQIRDALKLDRRELPRVLRQGVARKTLRAKGNKRATVYSVR